MIKILEISNKVAERLDSLKPIQVFDYKIIVRLNLEIDVIIVSDLIEIFEELVNEFSGYKINFKQVHRYELEEQSYLQNTFNSKDSIILGLKYRFNSLLNNKGDKLYRIEKTIQTPIVTFYSYKGGMGRTTTLTSYAMDLAINHNKKVCIIDCDFEAPGYMNFFSLGNNEVLKSGIRNGIVEFLVDYNFQDEIDIKNYIISYDELQLSELKNLFIVPAGNLSDSNIEGSLNYVTHRDHYLEALSRIDLSNEAVIVKGFETLFYEIENKIQPDIILIDSRTGFNDIFGVTALKLSDCIVGFFGSSEQTKPGLRFILDKYYEMKNLGNTQTELILVNSILPEDDKLSNEFHENFINEVGQYAELLQEKKGGKLVNEAPSIPKFFKLRRNSILEKIGVKENELDNSDYFNHLNLIKKKSFIDYISIFSGLNETNKISSIFKKEDAIVNAHIKTLELKNRILRKLKNQLRNVDGKPKLFAEEAEVRAETFFYRDCMKDIFVRDKFIIQGFKGTGKTYLYKALRNPELKEIKEILLELADVDKKNDFRFIDIISLKGRGEPKSFDFARIRSSEIKDKRSYFTNFWIVYTWNSIFLDAKEKLNFEYHSELQDMIKSISPDTETKRRFDNIIYNDDLIIKIENDLKALDTFLFEQKTTLFVLYDQLDNLIEPHEWGEAVSPLVDYWWNNLNHFSSISPKIFIRTDLYKRLKGTNTSRLENNKIKIEWSREEVYSYFFKLVFSDKESYDSLFEIMLRTKRYDDTFIKNTKRYLIRNHNQLNLYRNEIEPFMTIFFGKEVRSQQGSLGSTFDWFYFNLTNADQKSISLRPFINLVNGALDGALNDPERHIYQIIDQKYYATRENRENAVRQHFEDLVREDSNKDLAVIFNYLKEKGEQFKQIFLYKSELNEFLENILKENENVLESKSVDDLKEILVSNGIIHENIKPDENIFYFAQLYKYWLGLQSRKYEFKHNRKSGHKR